MNKKKITQKVFLLFLILLTGFIAYATFDIYSYGNVNELIKSDVAIVLGAGVEDNKPSPVFQERINHGIWLC